jgi:hypothetical protein
MLLINNILPDYFIMLNKILWIFLDQMVKRYFNQAFVPYKSIKIFF